ncbi:hypothetical protein GOFOIKOB_6565 [Methylobacterium tardum]|uniref:Glycosyl transferase n=2 Tax=Methylobacterium tardum TaxID=374432 RepID=A0AA37WW08_9HYPH|nr:hypothetical protein GOFOIKOB_6565 [Methylobacterium tardum]GLS74621.1 glycosyl transferase [Methylobacterium tardum]
MIYGLHRRSHGVWPNFLEQRTFSEKIASRILHPQKIYGPLTDKFFVREYVRQRIGSEYLTRLYDVVSREDDIDFDNLPSSFAMKATHGSGWVKLITDKTLTDSSEIVDAAASWLKMKYSKINLERHYDYIPPMIVFEELLTLRGELADDFKIHCFEKGGNRRQIVQVHTGRFTDHRVNLFDRDWSPIDVNHWHSRKDPSSIHKPDNLDELLRVAAELSRGFNYVRVDLYNIDGRIVFGELTFTPGAAKDKFNPPEMDSVWGTYFDSDEIYYRKK